MRTNFDIEHLRKQAKTDEDERAIQDCFQGIEKKHLPHILCLTNMLLHGIDVPSNVRHDNTLKRRLLDQRLADANITPLWYPSGEHQGVGEIVELLSAR